MLRTLAAWLLRLAPHSVPLTGAIAGLSLAGASVALLLIVEREGEAVYRYRDSLVWAASQLEKELLHLELAIADARHGADPGLIEERFDIAASRLDYLRVGSFATLKDANGAIAGAIATLATGIDALGERLHDPAALSDAALADLEDAVARDSRAAGALAVQANQAAALARMAARSEALRLYGALGAAVALLVASIVLGAGVVLRQYATIDAARAQSEAMRRELETALQAAQAGARAKSAFLATMSHEIRTPMNGVLGAASLLGGTALDARQRRLVDIIRGSGTTLLTLIDDILDFSMLEARRLELRPRDFDLRVAMAASAEVMAPAAQARRLDLVVVVAPAVAGLITADELRLRQIVLNLLSNAVKFTESGGVVVRAALRPAGTARGWLLVRVEDTGIGIPRAGQGRLFQEFVQADHGARHRPAGTGLGLVISRRLAEAMGGRVRFYSQEGAGSRFRLLLPVGLAGPPPAAPPMTGAPVRVAGGAPALRSALEALLAAAGFSLPAIPAPGTTVLLHVGETAPAGAARVVPWGAGTDLDAPVTAARLMAALSGKATAAEDSPPPVAAAAYALRVLVAEDDAVNQDIAVELLRHLGHQPELAADGAAAVQAVAGGGFDLLLLDMQMPVMDGVEVARAVRALPAACARIPIVAMSAASSDEARRIAFAAGVDSFISKPMTLAMVATAVRFCLAPSPTAVEPRQRTRLLAALSRERLGRMLVAYWTSVPGTLDVLAGAEAEAVRRGLHALRGSSANLGYTDVAAATADKAALEWLPAALDAALGADAAWLPAELVERCAARIAALRRARESVA